MNPEAENAVESPAVDGATALRGWIETETRARVVGMRRRPGGGRRQAYEVTLRTDGGDRSAFLRFDPFRLKPWDPSWVKARPRPNADSPAPSNAAAEASALTDFTRAAIIRTPSLIICQSTTNSVRLSSLSAISKDFRDSSGLK
jgi:hypothetical protein